MKKFLPMLLLACAGVLSCSQKEDYVDYVDPTIGNISHLLVPTYPTVQLPNSLLRVYPMRTEYTSEYVGGLPVMVTNHRERSVFSIRPCPDGVMPANGQYNYDNEHLTPYGFDVTLLDGAVQASYALSHQSAVYEINFIEGQKPSLALCSDKGEMQLAQDGSVSGWQEIPNATRVYLYAEFNVKPLLQSATSDCVMLSFDARSLRLRYGVSLISCEQAKANLYREIKGFDIDAVRAQGRKLWNETLGRIKVKGGTPEQKRVFYTSYYRTFERSICLSEDGRYFSAFDHKVHEDGGQAFYSDDWLWDTYRAAHPLRSITSPEVEEDILASFLRMAVQKGDMWMPTFPEINGDTRRMNSNHGIPVVAEALALGLDADYKALYEICSRAVDEKTLAPWSGAPAGMIDDFYKKNLYIPALAPGEKETDPNVDSFEKRQPIAVTLGTAYDQWCLGVIAERLGMKEEAQKRFRYALGYREVFNPETAFFHPRDSRREFLPDVDYSFSGGLGAREHYGENNAWVYRWDVPHNVADLVQLLGGAESFCNEMDRMYATPLSMSRYRFYAMLPDHTGNVGQFSMANEPSLHVPYLYNYAGKPWKTQKRIRQMLDTWFRDDLMGIPGDEDGGGMTSFVVFSMLGFYPVTPGTATYNIGSPVFEDASVTLGNGNIFRIKANNAGGDNKYIQSAKLNGVTWNKPWFSYEDIKDGAVLEFEMASTPNKSWAASLDSVPPSGF